MTIEGQIVVTPRMEEALDELQALIASRYPEATFSVSVGEDPDGIYLTATVVAVRPLLRNADILARQQAGFAALSSSGSTQGRHSKKGSQDAIRRRHQS